MFVDHRRLEVRARGHKQFIAYLLWVAEGISTATAQPLAERLKKTLDGLLGALDERKDKSRIGGSVLNATILYSDPKWEQRVYRILEQDSSNTFGVNTVLPVDHTVAGDVVGRGTEKGVPGLLVYVPWTKVRHGVSFEYTDGGRRMVVRNMDIIKDSYHRIDEPGQDKLGCVLCIKVPLEVEAVLVLDDGTSITSPSVVLSLSSPRIDSINIRAFEAARLISKLLPQVLQIRKQKG
jgi:hypothetical protein